MKRLILIVIVLCFGVALISQAPERISYQAVIFDSNNSVVTNENIGMRISILQGSSDGLSVYSEIHNTSTNVNGLVTIKIGSGITNDDFSLIDWSNSVYFIKTETDILGGENYTTTGVSQLLSVPYALHSKTAQTAKYTKGISVCTTNEIQELTPEIGNFVLNSSEDEVLLYNGTSWRLLASRCWPEPTRAATSGDLNVDGPHLSVNLDANTPEVGHGSGLWTIIDGEGGYIEDPTSPSSLFTGNSCTQYVLKWTISTTCDSSSAYVSIRFNHVSSEANAGVDQYYEDGRTSTRLMANTPEEEHGEGVWSIVKGDGGSVENPSLSSTTFTGNTREVYTLRWTISSDCSSSSDDLDIVFGDNTNGPILTDIENNTYKTVWIGSQLWMAENLKTSKYSDGVSLENVVSGPEWQDAEAAYCMYDNSVDSALKYGYLYNVQAALNGYPSDVNSIQGICPEGWHIPNKDEWGKLATYINATNDTILAGVLMKASSSWLDNGNGIDKYGFNALPGGMREGYQGWGDTYYAFKNINKAGYWWSSTHIGLGEGDYVDAEGFYSALLSITSGGLGNSYYRTNQLGYSVRCIKD